MNLFILDYDIDRCAEYHIDKHVGKMQLEATQLLATTQWVDKLLGYIPRKLTSDEIRVIKDACGKEPPIEERQFLRYLATHHNHPCAIWVRSSFDNYTYTHCYINALNEESIWRGNKPHASCAEANKMPLPKYIPSLGITPFALAMPEELKNKDAVKAYRNYYYRDKKEIATWKKRGKPFWWD
jgi:hypothetical protein